MTYTGNITITSLAWSESGGLVVRFASDHVRVHQLYIGRRLYGETRNSAVRELTAQLYNGGSRYPESVMVVAVDSASAGIDHGLKLPPRPYNRVRVTVPSRVLTGDARAEYARAWELCAGTRPGESVDADHVVASEVDDGNRPYTLESLPLGPSGTWNFGVRGRDETESGGNVGPLSPATADILSYPPDFEFDFTATVAGGIASVSVTIPED